jgi:polyisoprenoid-binding protein YceI
VRHLGIPGLAALSLVFASLTMPAFAAEVYHTDQGHTEVRLEWNHAGVSIQSAEFTTANGTVTLDPENVEKSSVTAKIDAASISTGFARLDTHLKSKDFLEVETYPEITFNSTGVKRTGDETADITGDLTIHGVTKAVTLKTKLTHRGNHPLGSVIDYYKGKWIAFSATTEIDHQAFGVGKFSTGPISITIVTEMKDRK